MEAFKLTAKTGEGMTELLEYLAQRRSNSKHVITTRIPSKANSSKKVEWRRRRDPFAVIEDRSSYCG
jgi:hypothetical protein